MEKFLRKLMRSRVRGREGVRGLGLGPKSDVIDNDVIVVNLKAHKMFKLIMNQQYVGNVGRGNFGKVQPLTYEY